MLHATIFMWNTILKCQTTDLIQAMTWIARKYVSDDFACFEMQRTCTTIAFKLCLSHLGQPRNDYTYSHDVIISLVIMKNRTYRLRPSSGHFRTWCALIDNFEFAKNKSFDVYILMWMLFWLGSFLKSCTYHFLDLVSTYQQQPVFRQCTTCALCGSCISSFAYTYMHVLTFWFV